MAAVISDTSFPHYNMRTASQRAPVDAPSPSCKFRAGERDRTRPRTEKPPPSPRPHPAHVAASRTPPSSVRDTHSGEGVARQAPACQVLPSPPLSSSPKDEDADTRMSTPSQSAEEPSRSSSRGRALANAPPRITRSLDDVRTYTGKTVKVRDLQHIRTFAAEITVPAADGTRTWKTGVEHPVKYEISEMPIMDIIEMVAGLLTKITMTNDSQHENLRRPSTVASDATSLTGLSTSVLAFHGKNVPSITIMSYLSRIHKYCPTTYEVFLSLLVFFDRMARRVNTAPSQDVVEAAAASTKSPGPEMDLDTEDPATSRHQSDNFSVEGSDLADSPASKSCGRESPDMEDFIDSADKISSPSTDNSDGELPISDKDEKSEVHPLAHFFVVDSFNIHRLVISGVTCASKFFSDVFYTNSRYAKVGGLPLPELNHLELQFLILNDFRLSIPVEELEAYGTMLVEFYAREALAQESTSPTKYDTTALHNAPA